MSTLWQDTRYGLRMLARSPCFAAVVVLILALGIGANTAVFSVVNTVLLRPLPYREPHRLVSFLQQRKGGAETNTARERFAYWREHHEVFEDIAGISYRQVYLTGVHRPQKIETKLVSPCFFSMMGLRPMLGRTFLTEVAVHRYLDDYFGEQRRTLLLLLGSAAFVLLIACSNVANLLLARAALRRQEMGVRRALGVSRGRIVRQVLTENILLSLVGGLLGLLVTHWADTLVLTRVRPSLRYGVRATDPVTFAGVALLLVAVALAASGVPAWRAARTNPMNVLRYK
ncbi:MAG: FtsX-like permease family protein [Planctomycetes bacterium]|jgi:hypothetical protein|nr:FtsX-like permease family protein [Planctomycetota bacterium]